MTQNSNLVTLPWTEEHESFCYKNKIPNAAKVLWQWLMRQGSISEEVEPDLSEFNAWVAKNRGKPYAHNYLKKIFEILCEHRVIQVVKQYSWKIFKLLVRPLDWLKPPRKKREKNLQNSNSTYNLPTPNNNSSVQADIQQQHSNIISNQATLSEVGIHFDESEKEVLDRPYSEIQVAIILFNLRGGIEKIQNPPGWIRSCLRHRYWEQPHSQNQLIQVIGNTTIWDELAGGSISHE
ncbi:hypothetical protein H6G41_08960 [Tolypothrix sp. FACHB-123]|uniref:hypothetical protein n=1 Tax=Tolypothrix sp. FACHB-123 TaxID=2692868 RepID=UPI001685C7D4|nr:hypothetical protein [Tolypothrix sp. FACHB-123]MBD2354757.1 hypothetical protein [Tolypothrix sp. FACHB-123]